MSNQRYSGRSQYMVESFDALTTSVDSNESQNMVLGFRKSFFKWLLLIQKTMPATAHRSSRTLWVPYRQCSQLLPGTRGNMLHLFPLCRGALFYP